MLDKRIYYVLCADNCKFESMTKEQILTAIEQAISTGEIKDVDTGFVTKIKEQNRGEGLSFWVGTQAQYNALTEKTEDCFYIITDDTTGEDLQQAIKELQEVIVNIADYIVEKNEIQIENSVYALPDITWYYEKQNNGIVKMYGKTSAMSLGAFFYWTPRLPIALVEKPFSITYGFDVLSNVAEESDAESYKLRAVTKYARSNEICIFLGNDGVKLDEVQVIINVVGKWK